MRIAFVNQPIDAILPPYQSSVGACTYGAACALAEACEVIVYGTKSRHKDFPSKYSEHNIQFKFLSVPFTDQVTAIAKEKFTKLVPSSSPPSGSHLLFRAFGRQVAEDLRRQNCDVIQVQHSSQYLPVIRALNPGAKLVLQLHAEWFSQNRPAILERRLRNVDLITTVSNYITEKTRRQFPMVADHCRTMYNGIDAAEFSREPSYDLTSLREKRILYSGALSPHKGVHVLLDAFSIIVKQYPQIRLDIVGPEANYPLAETFDLYDREMIQSVYQFYTYDWIRKVKAKLSLAPRDAGTYLSQLKQRLSAEARAKVTFHGFVPRPALVDLYYEADVFAFAPIWDEGFGIPPVEAMAAGVPVVATRSGAIPEMVKDNQTGFLVSKNDPRGLAEKLLRLLHDDDLRRTMGRAGRRWVHQNFTWGRVGEKMHECFADLCRLREPTETVGI